MRALIYFPIIHSPKDLGTLDTAVAKLRTAEQADKYHDAVEHFWAMIVTTIDTLGLDYTKVKLYQDGLPVCGKEKEIVDDVAGSGSQNYRLLQTLQQKGAELMGTESPELLVQEHALMTQLLNLGEPTEAAVKTAQVLLVQRDEFIAERIDKTLKDNEMGLLFLGLMHKIETKLPTDIVVLHPLGRPVGIGGHI